MAMTKKEKADFDAAIKQIALLGALRWTSPVKKDIPVPQSFGESTSGWDYNTHSSSVNQKWSDSVSHGDGPARTNRFCGSQNGRALFSSELLALKALRHAVELECAEKLRRIDEQIAAKERGSS